MKKAQLFQQPIFYIFILIVAALFLTFGVRTIFQLKDRADVIDLSNTVQDLKDVIGTYYSFEYGSSKQITISFNPKIEYICFTNNAPANIPSVLNKYGDLGKLFSLSKNNMFLFPVTAFKQNAFSIDYLKSQEDPLCFQNPLKAVITNRGDYVEISKNI